MSFTLEERVRFGYFGGNPTKKYVLLTLAAYADSDGTNAFPSIRTLAGIMECSERSVQNKLRELEGEGLIVQQATERWNDLPQYQRPNPYRINVEGIPKIDRKDVRSHLAQIAERDSKLPIPSAGDSEGGVQEVHTTRSRYSDNSSTTSVVPLTTSSEEEVESDSRGVRDDGEKNLNTFTEESSADRGRLEESDSQPASTPVTAPPTAVAESISAAPPANHQQTTNPPVKESLPRDTPGSQNGAQSLEGIQNPDRKARNEWRPKPGAIERAKEIAPDVNLEIEIVSYWIWVYEQGITPTDTHWMRRVMNEQRKHDAKKEADLRQRTLDQRIEKPWYEKELRF